MLARSLASSFNEWYFKCRHTIAGRKSEAENIYRKTARNNILFVFFEICTFFLGNTRNFPKKGLFFLIALLAQTRGMTIFSGFIETWNCEYDDFQVPPPPPHRIIYVKVALLSSNGTPKRKRKSFTAYMNF